MNRPKKKSIKINNLTASFLLFLIFNLQQGTRTCFPISSLKIHLNDWFISELTSDSQINGEKKVKISLLWHVISFRVSYWCVTIEYTKEVRCSATRLRCTKLVSSFRFLCFRFLAFALGPSADPRTANEWSDCVDRGRCISFHDGDFQHQVTKETSIIINWWSIISRCIYSDTCVIRKKVRIKSLYVNFDINIILL